MLLCQIGDGPPEEGFQAASDRTPRMKDSNCIGSHNEDQGYAEVVWLKGSSLQVFFVLPVGEWRRKQTAKAKSARYAVVNLEDGGG
ncbi:hypothetical protein Pcinc_044350 [Petrolisthes cinctipes]|uniref:Uncharacterized protein n=1 Tax=Petrolisthes cinctipes TaxID=88211 RepID=A0AAE1EH00_PETCI|nr:hypothetical protein Pcinc_044350 [Petrolisthes cinctipes]